MTVAKDSRTDEFKTTMPAPGVELWDCGIFYHLTGTKQALLASGLAKEEWFWSGRRDKMGRRLRVTRFAVDGNAAKCSPRYGHDGEYVIEVQFAQNEGRRRYRALQRANELADAERLDRLIEEDRREWMREAIGEKDGIRKIVQNRMNFGAARILAAFNESSSPDEPWTFPENTIEQVRWHLREIQTLLDEGGYKERPGAILQGDTAFQRFVGLAINGEARAR